MPPRDVVKIEAVDTEAGTFDAFTSCEVTNDLTAPAQATFECGDDGTWRSMEELIRPGSVYRVTVNDRLRLTGRVEANDIPVDAAGGATVRFVVRTKLADAAYASAKPDIKIDNATLKDIILRAYTPLGYTEKDFVFRGDVARDLMTGRPSKGDRIGGFKALKDLVPLQIEQAKVDPPETVFEFVERHLLRFHMSHWDSPDGKIVVGSPNDGQDPLYSFRLLKGRLGYANNLLTAHRVRDISDAPSRLIVQAKGGKIETGKGGISNVVLLPDVSPTDFYRQVIIVNKQLQNRDQAIAQSLRELTNRSKKVDAWEVMTDGWSFWDGESLTPYGIDTVADVMVDVAGGAVGPYLVHRTTMKLDPESGFTTSLGLLKRGLWIF